MAPPQAPLNPFRFGALAPDEAFTDRDAELKELRGDIRNGQDVVLFAPRRYGKSSLMWRAAQQPGRPLSGEYRHRHSLPVAATVQTSLEALGAQEIVARVGRGEYRISEPFLTEWINRNEV